MRTICPDGIDGAGLVYCSVKEDKNCDLLHKYLLHLLYTFPFTHAAHVVEKELLFMYVLESSSALLSAQVINEITRRFEFALCNKSHERDTAYLWPAEWESRSLPCGVQPDRVGQREEDLDCGGEHAAHESAEGRLEHRVQRRDHAAGRAAGHATQDGRRRRLERARGGRRRARARHRGRPGVPAAAAHAAAQAAGRAGRRAARRARRRLRARTSRRQRRALRLPHCQTGLSLLPQHIFPLLLLLFCYLILLLLI